MSVYGDPPDPIEDPRDDSERWEEAFKVMEDERAEFEATFRDLGFSLIRAPAHPQGVACSAHCDYLSYPTGVRLAWVAGTRRRSMGGVEMIGPDAGIVSVMMDAFAKAAKRRELPVLISQRTPRLRRENGVWICVRIHTGVGWGLTPAAAYRDWCEKLAGDSE